MKRALQASAVALALLAAPLLGAAFAQTAEPATPGVSTAKRKLAEALIEANDMNGLLEKMTAAMSQSVKTWTPALKDEKSAALMAAVQAKQAEITRGLVEDMKLRMVDIYARTLTETEMNDWIAWAKSPSAVSLRAKTPVIMAALMQAEAPAMQKAILDMGRAAVDASCQVNACTPAVHDMMIKTFNDRFSAAR